MRSPYIAVEQIVVAGQQRFGEMNQDGPSPKDKIHAFIDARLSLGEGSNEEAVKAWVLIGSEAVRQEEVQAIYKKFISQQQQYLANLLKEASTEKLTNTAYESKAAIILSAIEGAYLLGVTCKDILPKGFAAEQLNSII